MADSIHSQIVDAAVARLNATITTAGGYNYDLSPENGGGGAQELKPRYQPSLDSPWIVVDLWREDKDDTYAEHVTVTGQLHMQLNVELPQDETSIQKVLQRLVDDVEKCLGLAREEDPVLGVTGLGDIVLQGHTKIPWDTDDDYLSALMEVQVKFQHRGDDPALAP